jgi:hypothetical protein
MVIEMRGKCTNLNGKGSPFSILRSLKGKDAYLYANWFNKHKIASHRFHRISISENEKMLMPVIWILDA